MPQTKPDKAAVGASGRIQRLRRFHIGTSEIFDTEGAAKIITRAYEPLVKAAGNLEQCMTLIESHPNYRAVWDSAFLHGCPYTGPTWERELDTLRTALSECVGEKL
jgi:hypothetical protein